ncbi:MAG: glycosyltransferase family 2 protein [Candidatus Omnitrophica bacterium]|nr:glycosyltransferase family 2 protein [Candidatus Omnitrophota bacterium]
MAKNYAFIPSVSVVMSVWNEEKVIKDKLLNLLAMDYPVDKVEILVGSDGSTDSTPELVYQFKDERVRFFDYQERRGKMSVLNDLVKEARYDIVLFCDARQRFAPDVIKELTANFADPKVGCVSGELVIEDNGTGASQGVGMYWTYEKFIRREESGIHSIMGATGAIYAIRRELFKNVPTHIVLDDMFIPFSIIQLGYRAIFDPSAKAFDKAVQNSDEEFRRKVRTLAGNFQIFLLFPGIFNPLKSPIAWQLFSHKFLRLKIPFLMVLLFIINFLLFTNNLIYSVMACLQVVFYGCAMLGMMTQKNSGMIGKILKKIGAVPYMFCVLNFSALVGFWRFATSQQKVTWEKAVDK